MISIKINNNFFFVKKNLSILEACKFVGITVPRFCYQENLSIAGNCRMCLVEVEPSLKPVSACTLIISEDLKILTETPFVKKARENVLEMLLLNHPLDCPICDQGGECDLQDQTKLYGIKSSRFFFDKRGVEDKNINYFIKTIMTRCIHCTRCIRFSEEILGKKFLGTLSRGHTTEVGTYILGLLDSNMSGNIIDLCPVGALTSKAYAFKSRPWELKIVETIDLTDSVGSSIFVAVKESNIVRITPKKSSLFNTILISDICRFSYDAVNNLRVGTVYAKKKSWQPVNMSFFLAHLKLQTSNKVNTFIINEDLDFQSLQLLKTLNYSKGLQFKLCSTSFSGYLTNAYYGNIFCQMNILEHKINNSVFIFASNLKIENAILNSKLRSLYLKKTCALFSSTFFSSNIFSVTFLALKTKNIIKFFESKDMIFALKYILLKNPIIIFGSAFQSRGFKIALISYFKKVLPTVSIFNLNKAANTESNVFFNITFINTNWIIKSKNLLAFNLNATLFLHKLFTSFKTGIIYWFNSYSPYIVKSVNYIIPTSTIYETEGLFLNFEGRAQKAQKSILNLNKDILSLKFLVDFFNLSIYQKPLSVYSYFFEMCLLVTSKENNIFINITSNNIYVNYVIKYIIKTNTEDIYQANYFTKNSLNMFKRSKEIRAITTNFFKS